MAATTKQKFDAAVKIIQNLPKDGPVEPSNSMKLTFYGLYKQATIGPCNVAQPAFYNFIEKSKWEAWSALGSLSADDAMTQYIDELRKIIETSPFTDDAKNYIEIFGEFYDIADDGRPIQEDSFAYVIRSTRSKRKS